MGVVWLVLVVEEEGAWVVEAEVERVSVAEVEVEVTGLLLPGMMVTQTTAAAATRKITTAKTRRRRPACLDRRRPFRELGVRYGGKSGFMIAGIHQPKVRF